MLSFDVRTVLVILSVMNVFQAAVLELYYLVAPRYSGIRWWVVAGALSAFGFLLLIARGQIPDFLSIIVANSALVVASLVFHRGIVQFVGQPRQRQEVLVGVLTVATIGLLVLLTYVAPSVTARTVVIAFTVGVIHLLNSWNLARGASRELRFSFLYTATVLGLYGAWNLVRALLTALAEPLGSVFDQTVLQGLTFLAILLGLVLWTAGLGAMCTQRLLSELRQAQASERALLEQAAGEAHEREQLFRLTFDQSPLGAALIGLDFRFARVNPTLCAITGYSEAELLGLDFRSITHADDLPAGLAHTAALADGKIESYSIEKRLIRKNGAPVWVQMTGRLMGDAAGRPLHLLGLIEDIGARKAAEEALRHSRLQLEQALRGAELGLWDWHLPSGTMDANEQLARLLGYELAEIVPVVETWRANAHPDDLPRVEAAFEAAIGGQAAAIDIEFRMRHRDGSWRWQLCRGGVVEHDEHGATLRLLGVTQDITERKQAELALAESEALLRAVGDNVPNGATFQMIEGPFRSTSMTYISASVERLTGVAAQDIVDDPTRFWGLMLPEDQPRFLEAAQAAFEAVAPFDFEFRIRTADGRLKWLHAMATPRLLPNGQHESTGMAVEITRRKEAELALRFANDELRRRVGELSALHRIAQALTQWVDLASALEAVGATVSEMFAGAASGVWVVGDTGTIKRLAVAGGFDPDAPGEVEVAADAVLKRLLERPHSRVLAATAALPSIALTSPAEHHAAGDLMVLPLQTRGQAIGLLLVRAANSKLSWSPADLALGQTVAGTLANAIENARLFERAQAAAAEDERKRLARDLHDSVSQALFQVNLTAGVLPQLWEQNPQRGREALGHLQQMTQSAVAEMRNLLVELRPATLERAPLHELLPYLISASAAKAELEASSELAPLPLLPPEVQVAFYRVAQEALNNIVKHAGACNVRVRLHAEPVFNGAPGCWRGDVCLTVDDDGHGFDPQLPSGGRLGLAGMRERAAAIGAALEISSDVHSGTCTELRWTGAAADVKGAANVRSADPRTVRG